MTNVWSREEIIAELAAESARERLGLFVGTGFSKAASEEKAPTFGQLLDRLSQTLGVKLDFNDPKYKYKSPPQIASQLLDDFSKVYAGNVSAATAFRGKVADICTILPAPSKRTWYRDALKKIGASWIITTNYDEILECLVEPHVSVLPSDCFVASKTRTPILHIHGHRLYPETIRITEEDYVGLLTPFDYQRFKLPLLIFESTTLMLGYSVGDINVRVAMAWAHSFKHRPKWTTTLLSGRVVQGVRVKHPPIRNAYEGKDGQIIIEFDQIENLLSSIAARVVKRQQDNYTISESIKTYVSHPATAELVLKNPTAFQDYLKKVSSDSPEDTLPFVIGALDTVWKRAVEAQGSMSWDRYCAVLVWTLENLLGYPGPLAIELLAQRLDDFARYMLNPANDAAFRDARNRWAVVPNKLPRRLIAELTAYAEEQSLAGLKALLVYRIGGPVILTPIDQEFHPWPRGRR